VRPETSSRRRNRPTFLLVLAGALVTLAAYAAPAWKQLTSAQQGLIKPALLSEGGDFDRLSETRRAALIKGADRWLAMTPEQRTRATQQFQQFQQLSGPEKLAVLERRERFRKLPPEQRKALLDTQKQFLEMPLQQQQDLQDQFKDLQLQLEALPSQQFPTPSPSAPGNPPPLGLPVTNSLPGVSTLSPLLPPAP